MNLALFSSNDPHHEPHILIDSIVLLPVVRDLELFSGAADREEAWEMFQKYRCLENSKSVQKLPTTNICREYIFSASALLHQGAMECECDPSGSLSTVCDPNGGQCPCRPNVVGRKCGSCAPGTLQLGPSGCRSCECDPLGSKNAFCNATTGQCLCLPGVYGRQCAHCLPGHWGFPQCQPCFCNGHGDHCHPHTGQCLDCKDHTTGDQCEKFWVAGAPAHNRYLKHIAPDPYAPSCGWWAYGKVGLRCFFGLCPAESRRQRLDRKKVACTLQVGGEVLPQVEEFKYLRVLFTSEGRMDREIDRRISAAAAVMRSMYRSVVVKKELSRKAKLSIYQSLYVPTLTYGHELWVMTERVRSRIQAAEMSFLHRVAGRSLRDRVRSSVTREELGVEPLLLHIERGQLRWLGHLFRMPPGRLPGEVCEKGYHGNALLGSSDRCRPCMCPEGPGSGRQFADTCYQNPNSLQLFCVCSQGYKGPRCEECAPGYYGNPQVSGGRCHPCRCNGNIDMHDPMSCDARTGTCLRCLHNTVGQACERCRHGYYGDASTQNCQKCMCQLLGTDTRRCVDGECECDQVSGQCPCLPNVEGQYCDRCAANTWNFHSGKGCQTCQCHPTHSYSLSCDRMSGQCSCMPGFGGRTCDECRALFWGDPEVQCHACDCDPRGISTPQCNKSTGACVCVEGATGQRCDSCGRGYVGNFPDCQPCDQCFREWDVTVRELTNQTQQLVDTVENLKVTGVTAAYKDTIDNMEGGVKKLTQILEDDKAQQTLRYSQELLQQSKKIASDLDRSLNHSEVNVQQISEEHDRVVEELKSLSLETQKQQESINNTQQQVLRIKHSDPVGAVDSIREYYQQSSEAESQVNRATTDAHSPVEQSAGLRQATETKIDAVKGEFDLRQRLDSEILKTLNQELEQNDLSQLSQQGFPVCGGESSQDGCGVCGGLGCVGEDGEPQCGGQDCKGVIPQTNNVWKKAKDLDRDIMDSLREVEKLQRMVSSAQGRADESKVSAQDILLKTNQSKARVEQTNQELRELIQQIRDFLTSGTDLERIEALSDEVLKLKMPVVAGELKNVTTEIRQHVASLTGVDDVLAQSAEQAQTAERLLQQARAISEDSTHLRDEVDKVKAALNESEHTQSEADENLKAAKSDLEYTKQQIATVESETASSEFMLSNATQRLLELKTNVDEVRQKTREISNSAELAESRADYSSEDTEQTKRTLDLEVQPKYQSARGLIEEKGVGVSDARQRAEQLQQEAKDLMSDAINKLKHLSELERSFSVNQKTLAERAQEVEELENEAQAMLQELSQRVTIYSTCQ
ncbi:hypothetical protein QTP70_021002 [Hemibagrus guttatus]|uniref:Laminin subunit beta-1-like n=1 Tax=Hemibagrus guttatus TaxID=175788 RepID=A0AAE0QCP4_9TELE|nr:hypothetical protein QTP70_021002 [Hemibagrus guttatus]